MLLLLVLLTGHVGAELAVIKCCGEDGMLAADGRSCVKAHWVSNANMSTVHVYRNFGEQRTIYDKKWLQKWFPPGLKPDIVLFRDLVSEFSNFTNVQKVNSSAIWDPRNVRNDSYWRERIVIQGSSFNFYDTKLVRPIRGGRLGVRKMMSYCVDAITGPLSPFAVVFTAHCSLPTRPKDCSVKCCPPFNVIVARNKSWKCRNDTQFGWSPIRSASIDPETPVKFYHNHPCKMKDMRRRKLMVGGRRSEKPDTSLFEDFLFSSWTQCMDFLRHEDGSLEEILLYCKHPRTSSGIYTLLRPASFVAVLLLFVALAAIAANPRMRVTAHGWILACHASCLLGFNIVQAVIYFNERKHGAYGASPKRDDNVEKVCYKVALTLYFLLTAASSWLTALCINLALGFRRLRVAWSAGKKELRRFVALSVFAWGLPALLTFMCTYFERSNVRNRQSSQIFNKKEGSLFSPSFVETRTCYDEVFINDTPNLSQIISFKIGAVIFYYGPVGILVFSNIACLWMTLRKVKFLRRGSSILKREKLNEADSQRMTLYIKMVLMSGALETVFEILTWIPVGSERNEYTEGDRYEFFFLWFDDSLMYRATGYACDLFRATFVAWLAVPEGGYWGCLLSLLRGGRKGEK